MEFLSKIAVAIFFGLAVIFVSAVFVFIIITVKFKLLTSKRKRIQNELTKQEQRVLELSLLITNTMGLVNSYTSEISSIYQELQDKKDNYTPISTNNTENQK